MANLINFRNVIKLAQCGTEISGYQNRSLKHTLTGTLRQACLCQVAQLLKLAYHTCYWTNLRNNNANLNSQKDYFLYLNLQLNCNIQPQTMINSLQSSFWKANLILPCTSPSSWQKNTIHPSNSGPHLLSPSSWQANLNPPYSSLPYLVSHCSHMINNVMGFTTSQQLVPERIGKPPLLLCHTRTPVHP